MRIRACALALIVLSAPVISFAPKAVAQGAADPFTDMARQRFQEGVRLYDQGKYEEARAAFLQAYALKKHPAVLLNLAQSELRSNHPVEAARHFSEFLRDNPSAEAAERKAAQDGLTAARTQTGQIDVKVDVAGADVFVDGELVGRSPLAEPVDVAPGSRKVEARFPGHPTQTVDVTAQVGQVSPATLTMGAPGGPTPPPTAGPEGGGEDGAYSVSTEGRQPFVDWFVEDKVAWATAGAAVVGLGMGIGFALAARSASNNADNIAGQIKVVAERDDELTNYKGFDRTSNPCAAPIPVTSGTDYAPACSQLQDNLDARDTDKTLSTVGFVLAGLGAAGTGVLYFVRSKPAETESVAMSKPPEPTTVIAPVIGPDIRGFAIGGTF